MVVASCSNLGGKLLTLTEHSHWPLSVAIFLFIQWLPTQPWTPILCLIITEFSSQWVAYNFLIHLSENDILILIKESDKSLKPMVIMHMNDREAGTLMDIRAILLELECALAFQKGPVKMPVGWPYWFSCYRVGPRIRISNKSPGDVDAIGSGTALWEPLQYYMLIKVGKDISGTPFREVTVREEYNLSQIPSRLLSDILFFLKKYSFFL